MPADTMMPEEAPVHCPAAQFRLQHESKGPSCPQDVPDPGMAGAVHQLRATLLTLPGPWAPGLWLCSLDAGGGERL